MIFWARIIPFLLIIGLMFFMIDPISKNLDTTTNKVCYEKYCSKNTLDEFKECIDLGMEDVGFLTAEHFWLCDGNKITNTCLEWDEKITDRKYMFLGMRCEERRNSDGEGK